MSVLILLNLKPSVSTISIDLKCHSPLCVLHRTGVGLCVRLPDRGHAVVGHRVLPHHFSKYHRSWDFSHLWRCSSYRPGKLQPDYCDLTLTFCYKQQSVSDR